MLAALWGENDMARTNLPLSPLVVEGSLTTPAGTAVDQANGMNVAMTSTAIPPAGDAYKGLFFRVKNTAGSPFAVIIRAGVNPPAFRASIGDLSVTVPATTGDVMVGPLDMARHAQADDSVNVDFAVGFTGTITAFLAPGTV